MKSKSYQVILALMTIILTALAVAVFGFRFAQAQTPVGDYVSHAVSGNHINFSLEGGARVRIELCKTDLARIRMVPPGQEFTANEPYIIARYDWPDVGCAVTDEGTYIKIATGEMVIRAVKAPFKLDFYEEDNASVITGIAGRKDFTVFTVTKHTHAGKLETIRDVLEIFAKYKLKVEHIPSSIDGFSVIVNSKTSSEVFFDLMADITQSEGISDVAIDRDMALISVVGRNMSTKPGIAGKLFSRIGASGININLIAQSSKEINIVVGVKNNDFEDTIKAIYDAFVGKD